MLVVLAAVAVVVVVAVAVLVVVVVVVVAGVVELQAATNQEIPITTHTD